MRNVTYDPSRASALLRVGSGNPAASFRTQQEEAIRHVVEGRGRLLVVQKTGWGKSFVYFIAAKLLRDAGTGPAILVSPLLALMRNQIEAAERMGVRAATINSNNESEWNTVERRLARDEVDVLLVSPERFANERFFTTVFARIAARVSLLVIDEAHCISDWGHDFRPHYRLIERTTRAMPANMRILATTATANDRVMADLSEILGPDLTVNRGDLARPSLVLQTIRLPSQAERLAWLAERLSELEGSGIVYTLTVRDANLVARWLRERGLDVAAYHGDLEPADREQRERALLAGQVKALVATTALGMGFDKPDLAFVIHYQMPGSVVHYYQQVGRAGLWPSGGMPGYGLQGKIPASHQAQGGRALCAWGDAGWGDEVRRGKYRDHRFADDLVEACVQLVAAWNPRPAPTWVTGIPSLRHPTLVPDFAERLAAALGVPFHPVLVKTADRPEQKTMQNSTFRARNVDGSFAVAEADVPTGPVLLVDDIVDSRWTLTAAAWLLLDSGSGPVWPLALALAGSAS